MIRYIEQALRSTITGLSFVERYGGHAYPVSFAVNGEGGASIKAMPVSCGLNDARCLETGKYTHLVPDDRYKSVAYLEEQGPASIVYGGAKANEITAIQRVRLVCWLNMRRMGYDDCIGTMRFAAEALNAIKGRRAFTADAITGEMEINRASIMEKDPQRVFSRYSYSGLSWAFFWPYDFFAVEFEARVMVNAACFEGSTAQNEIECLTNW